MKRKKPLQSRLTAESALQTLSAEDLARAAIAGRESGNQIGLKLRDRQSKVTQSVLEFYERKTIGARKR